MKSPWFMDVHKQVAVMDRVAQINGYKSLEELHKVLDAAMEMLWEKVRVQYEKVGVRCAEPQGRSEGSIRAGYYMRRTS